MGIISTSISPAAGIITGTQAAADTARVSQTATANATQTIAPEPSAAILALSNDSKSRGASSGDKRAVDATFEKQSSGGRSDSSPKDKASGKGSIINIKA